MNGPNPAGVVSRDEHGQVVIHRTALGTAVPGEAGLGLPPCERTRPAIIECGQDHPFQLIGQLASVPVDSRLVLGWNIGVKYKRASALQHGSGVRVRGAEGETLIVAVSNGVSRAGTPCIRYIDSIGERRAKLGSDP
jgi:hypothetical protein